MAKTQTRKPLIEELRGSLQKVSVRYERVCQRLQGYGLSEVADDIALVHLAAKGGIEALLKVPSDFQAKPLPPKVLKEGDIVYVNGQSAKAYLALPGVTLTTPFTITYILPTGHMILSSGTGVTISLARNQIRMSP